MKETQSREWKSSWRDEYLKWIRVYDDRISVWNPGALPTDWTLDKLTGHHASVPHNPGIANAFFRAGMIEAWGRGIDAIVQACRATGAAVPNWDLAPGGVRLDLVFSRQQTREKTREKTKPAREETGKGDTADPLRTGKTSERILALAQRIPKITTGQMAAEVGISRKGVEWQIRRLKRAGRLERLGPAKGGRWRVVEAAVK